MFPLFPSGIIKQQVNSLATRHIVPAGPGVFDFIWTHFGFEDDTPDMTRRRLRQANLFGPAGFVSAADGEVIEFLPASFAQTRGHGETTPQPYRPGLPPSHPLSPQNPIPRMHPPSAHG